MSLVQKIKVIMDLFGDTALRLDIAQTIMFLFDVYSSGRADEGQIRSDLYDLFLTIANLAKPDLPPEEREAIAEQLTDEMINTFKIEGARKRVLARYRLM